MSKLADAIDRALRREARPIGFGANAARRIPTMLVFARVTGAADAAAAAAAGADAVITAGDHFPRSAEGAVMWGSEAPVQGRAGARALREAGADFLVFDDESTDAAALLEEDLGYVMRIALDVSDTFLGTVGVRTSPVEDLRLDALFVPGLDGPLTVRRMLDLRRVAGFARTGLILPVRTEIDPADLEALRDCGVVGVVADGPDGAAALRSKVDELPARRPRRKVRGSTVLLPSSVGVGHIDEPEEPEDDERHE